MVYGCDAPWWKHRGGLPDFPGIKVTWAGNGLPGFPGIRKVKIAKNRTGGGYTDEFLPGKPGDAIGGGGNSGFQALNLVVQMGARRILLIGFDMKNSGNVHWYGRNHWVGANNPNDNNFKRWLAAFEAAKPVLQALGVQVVNCSPITAMKTFPRWSLADAIDSWS